MRKFLVYFSIIAFIILMAIGGFYSGKYIFSKSKKHIQINSGQTLKPEIEFPQAKPEFSTASPELIKNSSCTSTTLFSTTTDSVYCFEKSKLTQNRGIEINLTDKKAILYENGKIIKTLPVAYQSPENVWFQTPTGYFNVGVKKQNHLSSLFPVIMPNSIQLYEDFFMHEIPYHLDGTPVTSSFSGGCLRFENGVAKELFDFAQKGDQIVVFKTLNSAETKSEITPPIDLKKYWIRQRFNNPLRQFWNRKGDLVHLGLDYYQHSGIDFAPNSTDSDQNIYAIYDGIISKIQKNDGINDHGLGNTVIIKHQINGQEIYSLYSHLANITNGLNEGQLISKGSIIGSVGNSGYGCPNYWKIGKSGCQDELKNLPNDTHLHFEIKIASTLENPTGGNICKENSSSPHPCWGYTPDDPVKFGYLNPMKFLFNQNNPEKVINAFPKPTE